MGLDAPQNPRQEFEDIAGTPRYDDDEEYEELERLRYDTPFTDEPESTDEGRLSRALQSWKRDYVITPVEPIARPPREPIFSAELRKKSIIERAPSTESLETHISLLSCSSGGERPNTVPTTKRRKRPRKRLTLQLPKETEFKSKWVEFANQRHGIFDKMMKHKSILQSATFGTANQEESDAFGAMDDEEKKLLYRAGLSKGIHCAKELRKSDSMTNIKTETVPTAVKRRTASASAKKGRGKPINLTELRKQAMNQKLAALDNQIKSSKLCNGSISQSKSILSGFSSNFSDTPSARSYTPENEVEEPVKMWKGDSQILEFDLKKELTTTVKYRIQVTSNALDRVTGLGEDNRGRNNIGVNQEYPNFTDQDFSSIPKISQKMRISPALSSVIKEDIKIRMGRPRYHEITTKDLEIWNRGQSLDRSHRNLKVFNWLHSLREHDFENHIDDNIPSDTVPSEAFHVESVDELDFTPLYLKSFHTA